MSLPFVFIDQDDWLFDEYSNLSKDYYGDPYSRYWTWQVALNLLSQYHSVNPLIIETGCQREPNDFGSGMSTSIFSKYISKYGGSLISVDNTAEHIERSKKFVIEWADKISFIEEDSIVFLSSYSGPPINFLYLDSLDYPYGDILDIYGGKEDINKAIEIVANLGTEEVYRRHSEIVAPAQKHCLNELKAIEEKLSLKTILLLDDNSLPGGGKTRLAKEYLTKEPGWTCVLDLQQSLWIKEL